VSVVDAVGTGCLHFQGRDEQGAYVLVNMWVLASTEKRGLPDRQQRTLSNVPRHGASSDCGWRRWPPDVEGSCKYIE
jgi:hypothetical protein